MSVDDVTTERCFHWRMSVAIRECYAEASAEVLRALILELVKREPDVVETVMGVVASNDAIINRRPSKESLDVVRATLCRMHACR